MASLARKVLLGLFLVVVLAVVVAAVLVKRALDPERLRPLAEQQLTALLHVPVRIGELSLQVLPSPALDGRGIDIGGQSTNAPPSLTVESLHLVPTLSTLLSPTIVIETVELRGLRLNVLRDADGRWALPGPTHFTTGGSTAPSRQPTAPAAPPVPSAHAAAPPAGETTSQGRSIEIRSFTLADGTVAVFDVGQSTPAVTIDAITARLRADARSVALQEIAGRIGASRLAGSGTIGVSTTALSLEWLDLRPEDMPRIFALLGIPPRPGVVVEGERPVTLELSRGTRGMDVKGTLAASRIVLPPLTLAGFRSPFTYGGEEFTFSPLQFTAYKGAFTGRVGASPAATPPTWRVNGTLEHLDVGEMLAATTSLGDKLRGTGRLTLAITGRRDMPAEASAAGTISMALTRGVIRDFPMLTAINRALQITEGSGTDTEFERMTGSFSLAGGRATTRDLQLVAGALTVSMAGAIGLESQSLDLQGTARFTREKSRELSEISKHVSGAKNENGEVELPLTITGSVAAPRFTVEVGKILANAAKKEIQRGIRRELKKLFRP